MEKNETRSISEFADDLLLKMLHRLPSKNVGATSVLSKRWRSLWKEVNTFRYDGSTVGREYWRLALFISKLSNLESLDLKINTYRTNIFINYLVNIAVARSLRKLRVDMFCSSFELPKSLFIHLSLDGYTLTPYPSDATSFLSLEHLEICSCSSEWWNLLTFILNDAPRLRVLKVNLFRKHCVQRDGMVSWNQPSSVPECLSSSHLEILEWRQYKGTKTEIEAAKYILWTNMLVTREMRKQNFIDGRLNAENNILIDVIIMNISIFRIIIITQLKPSAELRPFLVGYNLFHTSKTLVFVSQLLKCFITVSPIELFFITHLLISRFYPETSVSTAPESRNGNQGSGPRAWPIKACCGARLDIHLKMKLMVKKINLHLFIACW
uniref:Uncharacterized protein n=1 Tax=Brassica oleracea var. oleracea TaxID=109376 RepID=A0A0D3BMH0_BRAOL